MHRSTHHSNTELTRSSLPCARGVNGWRARCAFALALLVSSVALGGEPTDDCTTTCRVDSDSSVAVAILDPAASSDVPVSVTSPGDLAAWCEAVVIVMVEDGFGSGAVISPDGWVLTNYHVVESTVQASAIIGEPAQVSLLRCHVVNGRLKGEAMARTATVYKVDPHLDLALLKFDAHPQNGETLPHFALASRVALGESCYAIGSQGDGIPWGIKQGNVAALVQYPHDTTNAVVRRTIESDRGGRSTESLLERIDALIAYTTCPISPGDSGGPLLNANGELIGLTFATPSNLSMGSSGYHIAVDEIVEFIADVPSQPQGVPLDVLTAGWPASLRVPVPFLIDGNDDGIVEAVEMAFIDQDETHHVASAVFISLRNEIVEVDAADSASAFVPGGLWGGSDLDALAFDIFIMRRLDGVMAIGFTHGDGIVDEIRIDADGDTFADTYWRLSDDGGWVASVPVSQTPMIEPTDNLSSLDRRVILDAMNMAFEPGSPLSEE